MNYRDLSLQHGLLHDLFPTLPGWTHTTSQNQMTGDLYKPQSSHVFPLTYFLALFLGAELPCSLALDVLRLLEGSCESPSGLGNPSIEAVSDPEEIWVAPKDLWEKEKFTKNWLGITGSSYLKST